jgi:CRP-like cAMP-binding protein
VIIEAELLDALQKAPLFRDLEDADREELAASFKRLDVAPGDFLCRQGASSRTLFLIGHGRVEVDAHTASDEHVAVSVLSGGDVLGEFSLLDDEPRSASARALDAVRAYRLTGGAFDAFFAAHGDAVTKVLAAMNKELAARLRRLTARGRVSGAIPATLPIIEPPQPIEEDPSLWPVLREMSFFASFEDEDQDALLPRLLRWNLPAAYPVFREDGAPGGPYLILDGSVDVCVERGHQLRRLTTLESGRMFGEISLIDGKPRSATCITREETRLLQLPVEVFRDITAAGGPLANRLHRALGRSLVRSLRRGNRHQVA